MSRDEKSDILPTEPATNDYDAFPILDPELPSDEDERNAARLNRLGIDPDADPLEILEQLEALDDPSADGADESV